MPALTRREFGQLTLVGASMAATLPRGLTAAGRVVVGVTTSSFGHLPRTTGRDNVEDVIRAVSALRVRDIELAFSTVEPAPPPTAPFLGGSAAYPQRIVLTPEQIAATNAEARSALRVWRTTTSADALRATGEKFTAAGLRLHACAVAYNDSFTDEEIDATFRHARTLGVTTISSPVTMTMARRLAPFAERHQATLAIHNQVDGDRSGTMGGAQLAEALALSPRFALRLDIGNLTASGRDAVADVRAHQARLSHVVLKDRLRNGGASQPFGEGDTPIDGVLNALQSLSRPVPAFIEYDYIGVRPAADEIAASLAYAARTLE